MTTSSSRQNSRFSSLKVFKFAPAKPPPLPPKDPYYLHNPSLPSLGHSLSPDTPGSQPVTPLSAQYAGLIRSPSPSPSYAPSRVTMSPSTSSSTLSPESAGFRKGLQKLTSFSKRPRTPKSPEPGRTGDMQPLEPADDPSISLPWNFQHNVHVDEGYVGLPPTWSARLTDLGFSDDEITTIHARRAASRSLHSRSIYSLAPSATSSGTSASAVDRTSVATTVTQSTYRPHSPAYAHPPPRPPHGYVGSEASRSQSSLSSRASRARSHLRNISNGSRQQSDTPVSTSALSSEAASVDISYVSYSSTDADLSLSAFPQPPATRRTPPPPPAAQGHSRPFPPPAPSEVSTSTSASNSSGSSKEQPPRTPPRRAYHVANDSLSSISSPPPAYSTSRKHIPVNGVDEELVLSSSPQHVVVDSPGRAEAKATFAAASPKHQAKENDSVGIGLGVSRIQGGRGPSKLTMPPRLSLDKSTLDMEGWSASLLSALPPANEDPSASTHNKPLSTSTFPPLSFSSNPSFNSTSNPITALSVLHNAHPQLPSSSSSSSPPRSHTHTRTNTPPIRAVLAQKPAPLHDLPSRTLLSAPSRTSFSSTRSSTPPSSAHTSSPLWHEVMDMVRPSDSKPGSSLTVPGSTTSTSASSCMPPTSSDGPVGGCLLPPSLRSPRSPTLPSETSCDGKQDADEDEDKDEGEGEGEERTSGENDGLYASRGREKENRDSDMSTMTVTPATIVVGSVVRSARANVIVSTIPPARSNDDPSSLSLSDREKDNACRSTRSHSPFSSESGSSGSVTTFGSGSGTAYTRSSPVPSSRGTYFSKTSPLPSPLSTTFSAADLVLPLAHQEQEKEPYPPPSSDLTQFARPSILNGDALASGVVTDDTNDAPRSCISSCNPSPANPAPRYPGWVSAVVAPLRAFLDETVDPRVLFGELCEIGEGESGSVYAARILAPLFPSSSSSSAPSSSYVAIKNVPLLPSGSPKLEDLKRELSLMRNVQHPNILSMDALYVDVVEDSLWVRMQLMERSLADIVVLIEEGIVVEERPIAQFTRDVLHALSYLQTLGIAHRDLRSDNLLVSRDGVVKIADFSSAVQVSLDKPMQNDPAGVIYWQPPEMRKGSYNALKVDVWSLGATVWEMAQAEPPFSDITDPRQMADRWPPLHQPGMYSRSFHDFLHLCSQPSSLRPDPDELLKTPFILSASGRPAIIELLSDCRLTEGRLTRR
ncbi:hypothetical protein AcV5_010260 [Taiwanofungus camphoratus]|nr:hypothetical protein AcV5_010260 [Antrodia cinnamomea]